MSVIVNIDFTAGTTLINAFNEAKRIATILSCYVRFDFNELHCHVGQYDDAEEWINKINKDFLQKHRKQEVNNAIK